MRTFLSSVAGIVVAFAAMALFAWIGGSIFPISGNVSLRETDQIRAAFEMAGVGPKLVIIVSAALGALVGGALAKWLSGSRGPVWAVALFMAAYGFANAFFLAMPPVMLLGAVVGPLLAGMIAERVVPTRTLAEEDEDLAEEQPLEAHRDEPL